MNQIVLWKDIMLFWGRNNRAITPHSHPVVQLVVATQAHFLSKDDDGKWIEKTGLLIGPNQSHACDARGTHILNVSIDPESTLGEWISNQYLSQERIIDFPRASISNFDFPTLTQSVEQQNWPAIRRFLEGLFEFKTPVESVPKDERIEQVLEFIATNINEPITTKRLTEVVFLSESRLLHLFKEKMGLPIRNYILWYRLKMVFQAILKGYSLTQAAFEGGFADQAHLSRTCVKMMGLPPSAIVKNSKFVQVSFPN